MRSSLPMLSSLVLLVACSGTEPAPAPTTAEAPVADKSAAAAHMKAHFMKAYQAKEAVVAGRLEAAQEHLSWLATHEEGHDHDASWEPYLQAMRDAAKAGADATDLATAARSVAAVAGTCGSCHAAMDAGPTFVPTRPPLQEGDAKAHMDRHQWAAARVWEGLSGPSDVAWIDGISELAETPLHVHDGDIPDTVVALADHVHELGNQGASATDTEARVKVVGDLLATCASCHVATSSGPKRGGGGPG